MFISRISGDYDTVEAILFGSRARQVDLPDSDADIAILLHGERQRFLPTAIFRHRSRFDFGVMSPRRFRHIGASAFSA